ncbi:septum site-determining protein MinC [Neobacillus muris]|uniref:septum site-determining protein MinC n=1 Tax=Neobacillus muris TaxID=2941334 RepID=UPI00203EA998|nr:septum site-determining protein MinC [Neobacillus muris]
MKKRQNVTIKGTKGGLVLHLDDNCSFQELKLELDEKLSANTRTQDDRQLIPVTVNIGNRYLIEEQLEELKQLIRQKKNFAVDEIESNVMTKDEAKRLREETEVVTVASIVRSGQVLKVTGDLLLIGDVNPGGSVIAGGNIFVMGTLRGVAHAGCNGNEQAVIAASSMRPSQLRISDCINRISEAWQSEDNHDMECAYMNENRQIVFDRLQALMKIRPNLTRLEGGH